MKTQLILLCLLYYLIDHNNCIGFETIRFRSPCGTLRNSLYTTPTNFTEFLDQKLKELSEITLTADDSEVMVCSLSKEIKQKHAKMFEGTNYTIEYINIHNGLHVLTASKGENLLSKDYEKFNEAVVNYYSELIIRIRGTGVAITNDSKVVKLIIDKIGEQVLYDAAFFDKVKEFFSSLADSLRSRQPGNGDIIADLKKLFKEWNVDALLAKLTNNNG
jgi:hypothetical protein